MRKVVRSVVGFDCPDTDSSGVQRPEPIPVGYWQASDGRRYPPQPAPPSAAPAAAPLLGQAPATDSGWSSAPIDQVSSPIAISDNGAGGKKPIWRRRWFLIGAGLLVLIGIGGALSDPEEDVTSAIHADAEVTTTSGADDETTTTSETTTTTEPISTTTTSTTVKTWESFTVSGTGDDVVELAIPEDQPAVVAVEHSGSGNFAVVSYSSGGDRIDLLVNEIGSYQGRHGVNFLQGEEVAELEITAGGSWSVTASPLQDAASMTSSFEGAGDDVILFAGAGNRLEVTHDGERNFSVIAWGGSGRDLLINEIGPYSGAVRLDDGTILFTITADGAWTMAMG